MGQDWKGGDVIRYPGGGQKVNLLKPVVEKWKDEKNTVVMFVDRYICVVNVYLQMALFLSLSPSLFSFPSLSLSLSLCPSIVMM